MKPPFFRLGRSRLNGIISPPYPEVTLDTFSFLVGGCLAAWRAVSWPRLPKVALLGSKNAVFGPKPFFVDTRAKDSTEKCCLFGVPSWWWQKKLDGYEKKWIWGQKTAFLTKNSAFFYATPMKPPFFWLGRSRLNGMTTPPYPEVTLDTFGFPVGARLAARRAVLWPQLPKVALLGPKNAVFWPETSFFVVNLKIDCYNHDGTTKRQLWLYTLTCHNISKRFAAGCYFERASTNLVDFLDKQIIILVCSWLRRPGNASQGVSIYFIYYIIY